jgi:hypothetical protein
MYLVFVADAGGSLHHTERGHPQDEEGVLSLGEQEQRQQPLATLPAALLARHVPLREIGYDTIKDDVRIRALL